MLYSLKEIINSYYKGSRASNATYPNSRNYLTAFFKRWDLEEEWKNLRNGKQYMFDDREKEFIELLLLEKQGYLELDRKTKKYKNVNPEILFKISNEIQYLFRNSHNIEEINKKIEIYLTKVMKDEVTIVEYISNKIRETIEKKVIDHTTYLRVADKYYWMRLMEKEFSLFLTKWENIFDEMEDIVKTDVIEAISKQYLDMSAEDYEEILSNEYTQLLNKNTRYWKIDAEINELIKQMNLDFKSISNSPNNDKLTDLIKERENIEFLCFEEAMDNLIDMEEIEKAQLPSEELAYCAKIDYEIKESSLLIEMLKKAFGKLNCFNAYVKEKSSKKNI